MGELLVLAKLKRNNITMEVWFNKKLNVQLENVISPYAASNVLFRFAKKMAAPSQSINQANGFRLLQKFPNLLKLKRK